MSAPIQQVALLSSQSERVKCICTPEEGFCIGTMGTRLKVLQTFKALHRTRMVVFKDDERALTAARLKINEEFKKNKNETSEENIQEMVKMSRAVETILRENVLQAEHVGENKLVLRPRDSLLLENVPFCETPRKKA